MVSINYSAREVCCKIVYYGPGLSGKTTNLQYVHGKVPPNTRGKLISLATEADRTLYFDFLPINIGTIHGFQAKIQLYTVPGQVYYNATRKLVLRGVDGLVFVADSQPDKMDENVESLANLEENLVEYGYDINKLPLVMQYNKRDLPGVASIEELQERLNGSNWPYFEASATIGNGVFDTLKLIIRLVLERAKSSSSAKIASAQKQPQVESPAGTERVPAGSTAAAGAGATSASTAAAGAASSAAVKEPQAGRETGYRPYPGSDEPRSREPKASPAEQAPASARETDSVSEEPTGADDVAGMARDDDSSMDAPQMAPSLRLRGTTRKRGFFKRLFGIR